MTHEEKTQEFIAALRVAAAQLARYADQVELSGNRDTAEGLYDNCTLDAEGAIWDNIEIDHEPIPVRRPVHIQTVRPLARQYFTRDAFPGAFTFRDTGR